MDLWLVLNAKKVDYFDWLLGAGGDRKIKLDLT
jgi:hypothetical protein